ncbi:hypothetical protein LP417_06455 [Polaromonas sp. P1-6]|nr:hypothetical protein LP417_06455 [Polaromonas sp. P1-6]
MLGLLAGHRRYAHITALRSDAVAALGFQQTTENQRRYVVRWLRETLNGRSDRTSLLPEIKRWFYDHRILQIAPRELKSLIATAQKDHEAQLLKALELAYGQQKRLIQRFHVATSGAPKRSSRPSPRRQ